MRFFRRRPTVPVLRLAGPIGMVTPLKSGLSIGAAAAAIERAFTMSRTPTVAVIVNSPGGSPVQSHLIYKRIRQLAAEKEKRVHVFAEDVAASGGYFIALAGDEIWADPSSIVGSIGVVSAGFGFDKALARLGIDRRIHTAGEAKATLDPFSPERSEDVARLKALQADIHDVFKGIVKERRGAKLTGADSELFSGAFWTGMKAAELGLVDGLSDVRTKMRELHGEEVRLRIVPLEAGGWLSRRLRRLPGLAGAGSIGDDVVSAIEARALWARYGL